MVRKISPTTTIKGKTIKISKRPKKIITTKRKKTKSPARPISKRSLRFREGATGFTRPEPKTQTRFVTSRVSPRLTEQEKTQRRITVLQKQLRVLRREEALTGKGGLFGFGTVREQLDDFFFGPRVSTLPLTQEGQPKQIPKGKPSPEDLFRSQIGIRF